MSLFGLILKTLKKPLRMSPIIGQNLNFQNQEYEFPPGGSWLKT